MRKSFQVDSIDESFKVSEAIRELIPEYQVFCFHGDLGVGKTTYIKKVVADLGVKEGTSSPSFSIVNEYAISEKKVLYHLDLYRLKSPDELLDIGWEDYLNSNNPIFIEWPEKGGAHIPNDAIHIFITEESSVRTLLITDRND